MSRDDNIIPFPLNFPFPLQLPVPGVPITNTLFLRTIFAGLPEDRVAWTCAFPGDPAKDGTWSGIGVRPSDPWAAATVDWQAEVNNTFCTFSAFSGIERPDGSRDFVGRRKVLFAGMYAVMLDDLGAGPGSKIAPSQLPADLPPAWILETSPGNFQIGYLLRPVSINPNQAAALLDAMVHEGLQAEEDPGMKGVTRYGRMPVGSNGKPAYREKEGDPPFPHRLVHWDPGGGAHSLQAICAAFGLDLAWIERRTGQMAAETSRLVRAADDDPWLEVLRMAVGRVEEPHDKGLDGTWCDCTCPWVGEHTHGIDNGSAYMLGGGYQCHHGHCHHKTWHDVWRWLMEHEDPLVRYRAQALNAEQAFGNPPADLVIPPLDKAPDGAGVGRGYAKLYQRADALLPAGTGEARTALNDLLKDLVRSKVDEVEEETLIDLIADRAAIKKATLDRRLKSARKEAAEERAVAAAEARAAAEAAGAPAGRAVMPVIVAGKWRDCNEEGAPRSTSRNIEQLMHEAQGLVRLNDMTGRLEASNAFAGWTMDWVLHFLADACEINELRAPGRLVGMVRKIAEEYSFHPFQEYLAGLPPWDGQTDWRAMLAATVAVAEDDEPLRDLILERWFASLIAAGLHLYKGRRGLQPRGVLIFVGEQYSGKTTWLSRLFQGLFAGSETCFAGGAHFDGSTDSKLAVTGSLLTELGEIDSTLNRAEQGQLKAFLSQDTDRLRRPYGYEHEDRPRRTVFAGTVNKTEFLRDDTGNTRFWAIRTLGLDLDAQRRIDLNGFWAQVRDQTLAQLAEAGRRDSWHVPWLMQREEMERVEVSNEPHRELSPVEFWLKVKFKWDDPEYCRLKPGSKERAEINGMTMEELLQTFSPHGQHRHWSSTWTKPLQRLTGQRRGIKRRIEVNVWLNGRKTGEKTRKHGRIWEMPPPRGTTEKSPFEDDAGDS